MKVKVTIIGKTTGPHPFEAISASGNTLSMETTGGPRQGVHSRIVFRDDKHIQMIEDISAGGADFLR